MQVNDFVRKAYYAYFDMKLGDQDKAWAPDIACKTCAETFCHWTKRIKKMRFGISMIWRETMAQKICGRLLFLHHSSIWLYQ